MNKIFRAKKNRRARFSCAHPSQKHVNHYYDFSGLPILEKFIKAEWKWWTRDSRGCVRALSMRETTPYYNNTLLPLITEDIIKPFNPDREMSAMILYRALNILEEHLKKWNFSFFFHQATFTLKFNAFICLLLFNAGGIENTSRWLAKTGLPANSQSNLTEN